MITILDFYFAPEYLAIGLGKRMSTDDFDFTFDDEQFDEFEKHNIDDEIKRSPQGRAKFFEYRSS